MQEAMGKGRPAHQCICEKVSSENASTSASHLTSVAHVAYIFLVLAVEVDLALPLISPHFLSSFQKGR